MSWKHWRKKEYLFKVFFLGLVPLWLFQNGSHWENHKEDCVDYSALNNILPYVTKAHSKAKVVLTLDPVPNYDEIYVHLTGSKVISPYI